MGTSEAPGASRGTRRQTGSKDSSTTRLSGLVEIGVWLVLVLTPVALGSVSERATALMEGACFALLILAWWDGTRRGRPGLPAWVMGPSVCFCLWTVLQLVPLPPSMLQVVSPGTHSAYSRFLPGYASQQASVDVQSWLLARPGAPSDTLLWREQESTGLEGKLAIHPGWRAISWFPWETVRWLSRLLAYLAFLVLVSVYLPRRALEKRLPWLLVALGFGLSLLGIIQWLTWNGKIFWFISVYQGHPFGPWVNSNHFSGYLEMVFPLGCGLFLREMGFGRGRRRHRDKYRQTAPRLALCGFMLALMVPALVLARSRGGLFSLAMSSCFCAYVQLRPLLSRQTRRVVWNALALAPLLLCVAGMVFYVMKGREIYAPESGLELSFAARLNAWKGVVQMVAANPLAGTGLGTFGLAYPLYKTYGETGIWDQAHNEYLQLLTESGLIGFAIFLWGLAAFWRRGLWPRLSGPWRQQPPVIVGCSFGLLTLLAHSLVDFNLQIPSNGLLFILLSGLLLGETSESGAGGLSDRGQEGIHGG